MKEVSGEKTLMYLCTRLPFGVATSTKIKTKKKEGSKKMALSPCPRAQGF